MAAQAKLLRIVTDGQLLRVGSTRPRRVDVRVLVATHRNWRSASKKVSSRGLVLPAGRRRFISRLFAIAATTSVA